MKKLIAGVFAMSMATSAMAATIGFDYGSIWFYPRFSDVAADANVIGQGQTFTINWVMDSDVTVGVHTEALMMNDGYGNSYPWAVQTLQFSKGVVKNVAIGLRLGTVWDDMYNVDSTGALTDIFGTVTILSGSGDKVTGSLKAEVGSRWADTEWQGGYQWDGFTVGIAAGIAF